VIEQKLLSWKTRYADVKKKLQIQANGGNPTAIYPKILDTLLLNTNAMNQLCPRVVSGRSIPSTVLGHDDTHSFSLGTPTHHKKEPEN
jgi:hypothetical protein